MKPAASYARLSDTRTKNEPTTAYQHDRNVEYLRELGYSVAEDARYTEPIGHRSGRHIEQRPEMRRLMDELPRYRAVAFHDFSRFSRSIEFSFAFLHLAAKHKVKLYNTSARHEINAENAPSYIDTSFNAMLSEYESVAATDRMVNAYKRARENGWVSARRGRLGLKLDGSKESRHYEPSHDFPVVVEFLKLLADGESIYNSTVILRSYGYHARNLKGEPVLLQPFHLFGVARHLELYKPFVDAVLYDMAWRRVGERLNRASNSRPAKYPVGILRHLLVCSECGTRFRSSYDVNGHGDRYNAYYRHLTEYACPNNRRVRREICDEKIFSVLSQFVKEHPVDEPAELEQPNVESRCKELQRQLGNLRRILTMSSLTDSDLDDFNSQKSELERELNELALPRKKVERLPRPVLDAAIAIAVLPVEKLRAKALEQPTTFNLFLRDIFSKLILYPDNRIECVFLEDWRRPNCSV